MKHIFLMFVMCTVAYPGERNVLVEMFTNSHCSVCPGAHAAIDAYSSTSPNASRVRYIYYHTTFPYSDDPLSLANTTEPNARNSYYNGPTSTPNTFFDGTNQGRTYSSFAANLDARMAATSPLDIQLSGSKNGQSVTVTAAISQTGTISQNDLVVHMIAVENVTYVGRNGVSPQNFVVRKMITPIAGDPIVLNAGSAKQVMHSATLTNVVTMNFAGVVVFVQSVSTKEVYQSEYISTSMLTGVGQVEPSAPSDFSLSQNFPNPFNPSTSITFSVPRTGHVSLKVFGLLGNEVAALISGSLSAGVHTYQFSASEFRLSSGMYFYRLEADGRTIVRKMMLLQ
jgi:hypothetical protein